MDEFAVHTAGPLFEPGLSDHQVLLLLVDHLAQQVDVAFSVSDLVVDLNRNPTNFAREQLKTILVSDQYFIGTFRNL